MSAAKATVKFPCPGRAWEFHPKQELRIRVEPWLAKPMGLTTSATTPVIIPRVTVLRVFENVVVLKGATKEANFSRDGIAVLEMYKQGIVYQAPKPAEVRAAEERKAHPTGRVYVQDDEIIVQFPYSKEMVELVSKIPGEKEYNRADKTWRWVATSIAAATIIKHLQHTRIDLSAPELAKLAETAEADAREIQKRIDAAQAIKSVDPLTLAQPEGLKTTLWPHQLQAVHYAVQFRGTGLFLGMGAGKTLCTIAIALMLGVKRILIICPKQVLRVWEMEFEKHCSKPVHIVCLDAALGSMKKRVEHAKVEMAKADKLGLPCIVVLTPASAIRPPFGPQFSVDQKGRSTGQIAAKNLGWALTQGEGGANFDMVVVDEAQCLANYRTSISRMCWRFGQMAHVFKLGLSGTPTPNDPLQFFGVMRFINPKVFPGSYQEFEMRYAIVDAYHRVIEHRNLEEMQRLVFEQAYRVETKDVVKLPPQVFMERYYDLSTDEMKAYREMKKNMLTYLGSEALTAQNVLAQTLRLSQIVSGLVEDGTTGKLLHVGDSRIELLKEVMQEEIPAGEPVVIFARFKADIERIKRALSEMGLSAAEVSGRKSEWVEFQKGFFDTAVVQIRSGGAGIDLTRAAYVIYFGKDYGYGNYEQTLARVHRPGQTRTTTYISLIANGTVDEDVEAALSRKGNLISEFMRQRRVEIDVAKVQENTALDTEDLERVEAKAERMEVA